MFQEKTLDIWKKKLRWVAERGGMALVNVHPDYVCFHGVGHDYLEFPSAYYRDFLKWINVTLFGNPPLYALPKTIAQHVRTRKPAVPAHPVHPETNSDKSIARGTRMEWAVDSNVLREKFANIAV